MDLHSKVFVRRNILKTHSTYFTTRFRFGHLDGVADGPNLSRLEMPKTRIFTLNGRRILRPFLFLRSFLMHRIMDADRLVLYRCRHRGYGTGQIDYEIFHFIPANSFA